MTKISALFAGVLFALDLALNYAANALPINGYTTGELSALYPNLFTPAGFTFAIWGLIYLALAAHTIFLLKKSFAQNSHYPAKFNWLFATANGLNALWILAWHYRFVGLSLLLMLGLLLCLTQLYLQTIHYGSSWADRLLVRLPFSLYLGWISVATIANVTAYLVSIDFGRFGLPPNFYAAAVIFISCFLGLFMLHRFRDWVYIAVFLWAYFGIYSALESSGQLDPLLQSTLVLSAILLLYRFFKLSRESVKLRP